MNTVTHGASSASVWDLLDPRLMARTVWSHRAIAWNLARRDLRATYHEAQLGVLWTLIKPLATLAVYTFAFSTILGARWSRNGEESGGITWALTMFCGLLVFSFFAEVVNRSPRLIVGQPNFVKKVVFPLELLPVVSAMTALVSLGIGYAAWVIAYMVLERSLPSPGVLWLPVYIVPLVGLTLGGAWVLAALGVFLRDLGHMTGVATHLLFFATPIVYDYDLVPGRYRPILALNPLTHLVTGARRSLMWGEAPDAASLGALYVLAGVVAVVGFAVFSKSKRAFADVL